jgi:hypothetical protein
MGGHFQGHFQQSRCYAQIPSRSILSFVAGAVLAIAAGTAVRSADAEPPVLTAIEPSLGPVGAAYPVRVMLHGSGFLAAGNVVRFGPVTIPGLPSPDGSRITFDIPKLVPSRSEVPPMVLSAGDYPVSVTTPDGVSNSLMFKLTPNP